MTDQVYEFRGLSFAVREDTNDWNTVHACIVDDEYSLEHYDAEGKLCFDVGAYVGAIGIWLASRGARVVALEPVPPNAEMIRVCAALNGVDVEVLEVAAGERGTMQVRYDFRALDGWNEKVAEGSKSGNLHDEYVRECISHHRYVGTTVDGIPADQTFEERTVRSVTLSEMVETHGVPDFIKIDCEGGEWPWLADPAIASVGMVCGEWHPWDTRVAEPGGFRGTFLGNAGEVGLLSQDTVVKFLGDTHELRFEGPLGGPGNFWAVRRA